jgi:predicted dehydrogenase
VNKARVLIAGCGQLGSRHLQAVAALSEVESIEVYDPRPGGLELGRTRLAEVTDRKVDDVRWLTALDQASPCGDLCIVATRADVRCDVVREVAAKLGYRSFLIEKIVAQSVSEYRSLMQFAEETRLSVWVNCKARANLSHKRIKSMLDPNHPIVFTAQGGNFGLANNGVHAADLFAYFDSAESIESTASTVDLKLHPSKRGPDVFDLTGTLVGKTRKGSQFLLSYSDHDTPDCFTIVAPNYRAIVDDMQRWFWESSRQSDWAWERVAYEQNISVSFMTRMFAGDILGKGCCDLPTLSECFPAHAFILNSLQPHFEKLLGQSKSCPVT